MHGEKTNKVLILLGWGQRWEHETVALPSLERRGRANLQSFTVSGHEALDRHQARRASASASTGGCFHSVRLDGTGLAASLVDGTSCTAACLAALISGGIADSNVQRLRHLPSQLIHVAKRMQLHAIVLQRLRNRRRGGGTRTLTSPATFHGWRSLLCVGGVGRTKGTRLCEANKQQDKRHAGLEAVLVYTQKQNRGHNETYHARRDSLSGVPNRRPCCLVWQHVLANLALQERNTTQAIVSHLGIVDM